ncbi:MAG: 30S ribosomal protein S14 [Phycisphaerales bacterium]|nr:30S ribosomal protein S14 [Phycisphaerales bacterium]
MAKKSVEARQRKREQLNEQFKEKRKELKSQGNWTELDKLPRNGSAVRLKNRCKLTGRARGYIRYFGVSRLVFRDMALNGKIPGVRKASW